MSDLEDSMLRTLSLQSMEETAKPQFYPALSAREVLLKTAVICDFSSEITILLHDVHVYGWAQLMMTQYRGFRGLNSTFPLKITKNRGLVSQNILNFWKSGI